MRYYLCQDDYITIRPPTAVPADRQHSVRRPCVQLNCTSYLEQFTDYHSNSIHYQHFSTTPQDSSFLRQHRHRLTVTIRACDSNFCFDIWRVTNADYLLSYLLTLCNCLLINIAEKCWCPIDVVDALLEAKTIQRIQHFPAMSVTLNSARICQIRLEQPDADDGAWIKCSLYLKLRLIVSINASNLLKQRNVLSVLL